jgi:SpoVK/Ycf46/Vps4 family AAA+-type ATPase
VVSAPKIPTQTKLTLDLASIETTFADVFVDPSIVEALQTIVSLPLLFPSYFKSGVLAKEAIGGILLYGPPGTGKTMLCRALAKTSKSRMIHIKPSDINDKCVGESEKKVAAVFVSISPLKSSIGG